MTHGVFPEDISDNCGFSLATAVGGLEDGKEVHRRPPRAEFLRPFALDAVRVSGVLSVFASNGEFFNPDFPSHWPHSRLLSYRLLDAAKQLKAKIEETYCFRCRVKRDEEPRFLKVHEIILHIIPFEENMEIHSLYDCCRIFVECDGKHLPAEIVRRFLRSAGAIQKALEQYVAEESASADFHEYNYNGGIQGDKERERYLLLKKHGQDRYTYRELRRIGFVDAGADDNKIRNAVRELTTALRNWEHATHECGKIRGEDAVFFRSVRAEKSS